MKSILWLGSQSSHEAYTANVARIMAMSVERLDQPLPEAALLEVHGNVGVINIAGSLVHGYAGWGRYFGNVGYEDIKEALVAAVSHPNVGSILLNIDSPGGHVNGVQDTANFITKVDKVKPVVTYTGGSMHSAALWIGSQGRQIFASETSNVGSIGILQVHKEYSEQLKADGVKYTVIRAGKYKALATPFEPLPAAEKGRMEAEATAYYDIFIRTVAEGRGIPTDTADKAFGQGLTFVGKQASDVGLVDKVMNYDEAYTEASKLAVKTLAKAQKSGAAGSAYSSTPNNAALSGTPPLAMAGLPDNSAIAKGNPMPKPYTPEMLAAIAAGVPLSTLVAGDAGEGADAAAVAAAAALAAASAATPPGVAAPATNVTTIAGAPGAAATTEVSALDSLTAILTTALSEKATVTATLALAQAEVTAQKTAADAARTAALPFVEIARNSLKGMAVALNQSLDVASLTADQVLAQHTAMSASFADKFKAGQVAATAPGKNVGADKAPSLSPVAQARFQSLKK